ncbi:hypothetical protein ACFQ38_00325 [Sporosarcina contaminans]|uniref:Uncharacterized protein n=1 Tax=Sporosarcina contaminans TaxID=633403 RepID=A0ABW3TT84_9BACL
MENVKNYQVKTKPVTALRTYHGMPLHYIRDYMIGCKNIHMSLSNVHEGFTETIKGQGSPDLNPGDYIVRDEDGYAAFMSPEEFESNYVERVSLSELHYVIRTYGFSVEGAEYMLRDEKTRAFLLASLHEQNKASSRSQTANHIHINTQSDVDVDRVVKKINEQFEKDLKANTSLQ